MSLLTVSGVSKKIKAHVTVRDVSFTQAAFQKIAIAGETGSGKTTLLKMIAGLEQPDAGTILFRQQKVRGPNDQLIPGHAGIAYLGQHFELRNNYWVHEILSYANELSPKQADTLYRICRIDHLLHRRTDQLSGGERQRIALTRLLIGSPQLLLLDEPFSNLDFVHKRIIKNVLHDIGVELGISTILVSHDAGDLLSWADTILVMRAGELVQQAPPKEVYYRPLNEYCAGLFGNYNLLHSADIHLLYPATEIIPAGKNVLVRPEQLLVSGSGSGLQVTVKNVLFMGSYYLLEVVTGTRLLQVYSSSTFEAGQTLCLSVLPGSAWFV